MGGTAYLGQTAGRVQVAAMERRRGGGGVGGGRAAPQLIEVRGLAVVAFKYAKP